MHFSDEYSLKENSETAADILSIQKALLLENGNVMTIYVLQSKAISFEYLRPVRTQKCMKL